MAGARLLVDDERAQRLPRAFLTLRRAAALAAVVVATLAGSYLALVSFRQDRELSVGTIRLSVSPGHKGALDVYVPLVDWGARFEAIRLPARLRVDLKTVDRDVVKRVAQGDQLDVDQVRKEARDAIATYLRNLIMIVFLCGGSLGVLVAFAVRGGATPKLRYTIGTAIGTAVAHRRRAGRPPPAARRDRATRSTTPSAPTSRARSRRSRPRSAASERLDQELNAQLVGLARLVTAPANRPALEDRPRLTLASDLHNNIVSIPILERTAARGPVFFAGDLTDRGSPIEAVARPARRQHRQAVRVRARQPRLGPALPRARPRRRGRAHPHGPAENRRERRPATRSSTSTASGSPATTTRSSAAAARASPTATTARRTRRSSSASRPGCGRSATTSTSSWSTTPRC